MKKGFHAVCLTVILFALLTPSFPAQKTIPPPGFGVFPVSEKGISEALSPEAERRLDTFRIVWQTISDNYFDRNFGGLNWNQIKNEFEPRVRRALSDVELHALLQEMINRLNKSHFVIIPPEVFREIGKAQAEFKEKIRTLENKSKNDEPSVLNKAEKLEKPAYYGIGIDLRVIDRQIVVTRVEKDSPAARAGLKTGCVIEKINGVSLASFLETFRQNGVYAQVYEKQLPALLMSLIDGENGDAPVNLGFTGGGKQSREIAIRRERASGEFVKILSNLPAQFVRFEAESLDEDTAYVKFNAFALKTVEKFCAAVSQFKNKKALIIDVRGNSGGNFGALFGITSLLIDRGFIIGTEINKFGKEARFVQPQVKNYKGRLVVLTDAQSFSAAEVFAAGLQENDRATIIGESSAGSALPALTMPLPTGAVFLYPVANFETPKGNLLEGSGVKPNIKIALDRKSLLAGRDAQLDAAIKFLKDEIRKAPARVETNLTKTGETPKPFTFGAAVNMTNASSVKFLKDENALKIIDEYIEAVGGRENLKKLNSMIAVGKVEMKQAGAIVEGDVEIYRKFPDKIAKILRIEALGEIDEVFDGVNSFVQTDFMGTQKNEVRTSEIGLAANFRELLDARELYPSITFETSFQNKDRKINLVKAVSARGTSVYFAFDAETKLLISRAGAGISAAYDDYRKVGEWLFPFRISESNLTYKLDRIVPNAPVDDRRFAPKESCFTKID